MPRKGKRLKRLRNGQLLGSSTANELIDFFNAFMVARVVDGASNDILIGDLAILFKIKRGTTSGGSSGAYRGEYEPSGATEFNPGEFAFGDIVRVTPSNTVATTATPAGTVIPGTYICIQDSPTSSDLPNHPLSTGGETAFWQLIATYPSLRQMCDPDTGLTVDTFTDSQNKP